MEVKPSSAKTTAGRKKQGGQKQTLGKRLPVLQEVHPSTPSSQRSPTRTGVAGREPFYCLHTSLESPEGQSTPPFRAGLAAGNRYYCGNPGLCPSIQLRDWGAPGQDSISSPAHWCRLQGVRAHCCFSTHLPWESQQCWESFPRKLLAGTQAVTLSF